MPLNRLFSVPDDICHSYIPIFPYMKSSELWKDDNESLYNIPVGVPFTMTLQTSRETKSKELSTQLF